MATSVESRQRRASLLDALFPSFLPAAVIQVLHTFMTQFAHSPGLAYGAPLAVGESQFELFFGTGVHTFNPALFLIDLLITWTLIAGIAWWAGGLAAFLSILASVASVVVFFAMALAGWPVAGLPLPYWLASPLSSPLVIWLDMILWSAGAAWVIRRIRARPRDRKPESAPVERLSATPQ